MTTPSSMFCLVDLALGHTLKAQLAAWHRAGVSKRAAAALLTEQLDGIPISHETVGRWMREVSA